MPYQAIESAYEHAPFASEEIAQNFLDQFQSITQFQIISAMYLGREHLHDGQFRKDLIQYASPDGLAKYCDHIEKDEFALLLKQKEGNAKKYFERFLVCLNAASPKN